MEGTSTFEISNLLKNLKENLKRNNRCVFEFSYEKHKNDYFYILNQLCCCFDLEISQSTWLKILINIVYENPQYIANEAIISFLLDQCFIEAKSNNKEIVFIQEDLLSENMSNNFILTNFFEKIDNLYILKNLNDHKLFQYFKTKFQAEDFECVQISTDSLNDREIHEFFEFYFPNINSDEKQILTNQTESNLNLLLEFHS